MVDLSLYRALQPPERRNALTALSQLVNARQAIQQLQTRQQPDRRQVFALEQLRMMNPAAAFGIGDLAQLYYLSQLVPRTTPRAGVGGSMARPPIPTQTAAPPAAAPYGWMSPWIRTP